MRITITRILQLLPLLYCFIRSGSTTLPSAVQGLSSTEWKAVDYNAISIPNIGNEPTPFPYFLQIKAEVTVENADNLVIMLGEPKITIKVIDMTLQTSHCEVEESLPKIIYDRYEVANWTMGVYQNKIEFSLNGQFLINNANRCFMEFVRATNDIQFSDLDKVSKQYRFAEPCMTYPEDWTNIEPNQSGAISPGTTVTLTCQEGVHRGSKVAICESGNEWTFHEKPNCVQQCTTVKEKEFPNMFFIPALPAYKGDELQVQCFGGTVHLGAEMVTCVSGSDYNHDSEKYKPNCREIGKN